ncbi:MAG: HAMP domain-containing sensor histidine kinase [Myxococcaceae bacterium]
MFRHRHHEHLHRHFEGRGPWRRPMGPIGRFVRARLRRRIFAWLLGSMITTGFIVFLVLSLVMKMQQPEWAHTYERTRDWVGHQFARDWGNPAAREQYARQTATDLGAELELVDATGATVLVTGEMCHHPDLIAPVKSAEGATLGDVRICLQHPASFGGRFFGFLFIALGAVWMVSGRVARRLARPLDELTEVVKRIGQGDLKARTDLACYEPDELGVVADAVNDMAARIEKQVENQRELLATVSHELRTPLARMRVISEIGRDTGASTKTFDELDREVVEMDSLVGELLANSRLEFGQVNRRELSVRDVAARAVERAGLNPTALSVAGEADSLQADPTLLQRALANLFDNAKKHAQGADAFEVKVEDQLVRFEVLDRGPGVNGDAAQLFEKFNRGQDGQGADGLGLGLALVRRIARAHGGDVWATPRDGGGARFGFSIARA